uniref:Uncharacterized protein n=1 Tax=Arundo donax TaxID=35708 RepID=A0A0A8ZNJ3_ARUDO
MYLVERAPTLKTLRLLGASLSHHVLHEAIQKLPLLESLEVSLWDFNESAYEKLFPSVCEACPCLKKISLRLITSYSYGYDYEKDMAILDGAKCRIPIMRELRSLELNKCRLTEMKLMAIINNCPVLESLYINVCFISRVSKMVEWIQAKYARVKVLAVIADSDEECYA